jgi:peptidoglycan hydrolase-like protein with peptidoglycan-binding domain
MKIKLAISLFSVLSLFVFSSTAFATLKVTPDKPVEPEFVCKTESDIPSARAMAITRGGGRDMTDSSEALCRSQILANTPVSNINTTNNYYYSAPVIPQIDQAEVRQRICKNILDGGQVIDGHCTCPADKIAKKISDEKFECVDIPKFTPMASTTSIDTHQLEPLQPVATSTTSRTTLLKTLKTGSSGAEVKILQSMLGVEPTGYFGAKTREAVVKFQKLNKLPQSGVVGDLTRKALNK